MATLLKKRGGKLLSEDEIMLKFVQICLGLMHVHNKVALPPSVSTQCMCISQTGSKPFGSLSACSAVCANPQQPTIRSQQPCPCRASYTGT